MNPTALALTEPEDVTGLSDEQLVAQINDAHEKALHHYRVSLAYALIAGCRLAEARRRYPGTYERWVKRNCRFAPRTARNYLRIYSNRHLWQVRAANTQTIVDAVKVLKDIAAKERDEDRAAFLGTLPDPTEEHPDLHECDFRELPVEAGSASLVVIDPPWSRESLPLYAEAAKKANEWLKPGGLCLVYVAHHFLPDIVAGVGTHLTYRWPLVIKHSARGGYAMEAIKTYHRIVLMYAKGRYEHPPTEWANDVYEAEYERAEMKRWHPWEQHLGAVTYFVERFSRPGELVVDPFLGGGTTAVAAFRTGRRFIGGDKEPAVIENVNKRLSLIASECVGSATDNQGTTPQENEP